MMQAVKNHRNLDELLQSIGLPVGFDIGDLHLVFDEEQQGQVSKQEFLEGMFRLIFNNDFHRSCCLLLTMAQVKQVVNSCTAEIKEEIRKCSSLPADVNPAQRGN